MGRERKTGEVYSRVEATRFERNRAFRVSVYCYYSPEIYRIYVQKEPMEPGRTLLSLSLSLVPLCVLWEKDNTCYLRWSYKEKFRIKFFELWYVFAHQWTVYLLRKRKYAIPELRRFVLHLILFIFLLLLFFSRFCVIFPSRIVFFSSRREWSKRTNERWTRRFFTKIFIRVTKEMGKACFIFFSNIVKRIMLSMLLCPMIL